MTRTITGKQEILSDLEKRVNDKILEQSNFDLLKKLIENAESLDEAIKIAELGTTYKRTGFHFEKRLERQSNDIAYFKKNDALSFTTDPKAITHKLIVGDNYPALLNLLVEYKGRIDVIYIDPPYGKDKMGEFAKTNYDNALTRDNLLSMLYPRLWVAKQLLSDSGIIFCSIDDRNQAYLKCLLDEVFEEENFRNSIIIRRGVKSVQAQFDTWDKLGIGYETVLMYTKRGDYRFPKQEKEVNDKTTGSWNNHWRGTDRPTMRYELFGITPESGQWRWSKERSLEGIENYQQLLNDLSAQKLAITQENIDKWYKEKTNDFEDEVDLLRLSDNNKPEHYIPATGSQLLNDVWFDFPPNSSCTLKQIFGKKVFDNPKPLQLIERCMAFVEKDAIILDFFAGSGTTGQAVLELNKEDGGKRQFILVTNNEATATTPNGIVVDATSKRLKRVMTGKCYDGTSDFDWAKKNKPLGGNLLVLDMGTVFNREANAGKTAFDVIDETLYGNKKFKTVKEKVEWVCNNFEVTQKRLED